jgi:hypothetical protein
MPYNYLNFDSYRVGTDWLFFPSSMVDSSVSSNSYTYVSGDCEYIFLSPFTHPTSNNITNVTVRLNGKYTYAPSGASKINLRFVYPSGYGNPHYMPLETYNSWTPSVSLMTDANRPNPWTWDNINNLRCQVFACMPTGAVYCSMVQCIVAYS